MHLHSKIVGSKQESLKTVLEMRAKLFQQMLSLEDKLDAVVAGTAVVPVPPSATSGTGSEQFSRHASSKSTPMSVRRISKESGHTELLTSKSLSSASRLDERSARSTPSVVKERMHPKAFTELQPSAQPNMLGDLDGEPSIEPAELPAGS
eukprot:symbB.v1.2.040540.t1/scaffold7317.1/size11966/1